MKKILTISIWVILVSGLIVCLGFVGHKEDSLPCKTLDITIQQGDDNFFVQPEDVKKLIQERGDSVVNQPVSSLDVPALENALNSHPAISKSEVYVTIDGEVKVDIKQRRPLLRIIDENNESYYIDDEGRFMPLSDKYTAKVLIANGHFREPYNTHYMYTMKQIKSDSLLRDSTFVDDLYDLAKYINADSFWKSQIEQVYINDNKEIELVPRVGNHRIILGDLTDLDEKFKKLLIFYRQGLNTTGWWNKYSVINLKFKNQVVCTKKEISNL